MSLPAMKRITPSRKATIDEFERGYLGTRSCKVQERPERQQDETQRVRPGRLVEEAPAFVPHEIQGYRKDQKPVAVVLFPRPYGDELPDGLMVEKNEERRKDQEVQSELFRSGRPRA